MGRRAFQGTGATRSRFAVALLLMLAFSLFGNTLRASICAIDDALPVASAAAGAAVLVDAPGAVDDDGCMSCCGCVRCAGCCVQAAAPTCLAALSIAAVPAGFERAPAPCGEPQRRPTELLRPPIAA